MGTEDVDAGSMVIELVRLRSQSGTGAATLQGAKKHSANGGGIG